MGAQNLFNFRKWIFMAGAISIFVGMVFFYYGFDHVGATKEREFMETTMTDSMLKVTIPPIDRSAPLRTETATFALG
jgi:hypothetical protein